MVKVMKINNFLFRNFPSLMRTIILKYVPVLYPCFNYSPHFAALNITDNCCFRCVMCDQWKTHTENELTTEEWINILRQLRRVGIRAVSFAGGEAFLRKDLIELISMASSLGMDTTVTTNGFLLNEDNINKAIGAGVKHFTISVDAIGQDFDRIRGIKGAYAKVLNSCQILSTYKEKGLISVHLYYTLMKSTLTVYKDVFSLAETFRFPFVVNLFDYTPYFFKSLKTDKNKFWIDDADLEGLEKLQEFVRGKKKNDRNSVYHIYSEINYFKKYFKDPLSKNIPCSVSQQRLGIDSQGNVYGGCWSMGSRGSLRESALDAIMSSTEYKEKHRDMFFKNCPGCSCGYTTNIRHFLPAIISETVLSLKYFFNKNSNE